MNSLLACSGHLAVGVHRFSHETWCMAHDLSQARLEFHRHAWNLSHARCPPPLWSGLWVGVLTFVLILVLTLGFGVGFGGGSGAEAPMVVRRGDIEGHLCLAR